MLAVGMLLVVVGIGAVVAAHRLAPPRYGYMAIAVTEKVVLLGLALALIGGVGSAVTRYFYKP
jgi:hypothetical protein